MPTGKTWAINCVLLGAKVIKLIEKGKEEEAREQIRQLTSEFEPEDIDYIIFRLKEVNNEYNLYPYK